ncbi:acyltransferase Pun1-like [Argentina anserina]|uniref:acyltransferase Pun1-like n=1 Tax=Argentina anserina TaxID=57926 RepID=UPI0021763D36|nr:acyltransferase Pun1-like [Potentilla anserina]
MATVQLEVISRELIKPYSQTPPHLRNFNLSYFDQISTPMYIPLVFFYNPCNTTASTSETSNRLKKSLSETLTLYYPFAGKVKDREFIDCNDEGVLFIEAKVKVKLPEILDNPKDEILESLFADNLQWKDTSLSSLLAVQVSYFDCGGMALSVCMAHKIGDAATMVNFVNDWAAKSSNSGKQVAPLLYTPPIFPRGDLPLKPESSHKKVKCISRRFVFDAPKIAALKAIVADRVQKPTRVEVVSGILYKCAISTANANSSGTTRPALFVQNVNLRSRMVPPLPDNYVGNLSWIFPVPMREDSFHSLVVQMKEGLSDFCNTYVKDSRGTDLVMSIKKNMEKVKEMYKSSEVQYMCSGWCRFPIYEADFGWGKPVWVSIGACLDKNVMILMDDRSGDGIEAFVTLEEQHMAAFESDQELLAFAALNPTPIASQV